MDEADLSSSWQAVGFIAGAGTEEDSATKAQGFHRKDMLIIIEETPGVKLSLMTAFKQTSVGGHNLLQALGNPDSKLDALHQFCVLDRVKNFRISAYDYPNVVLAKDVFPGAVTQDSIDNRLKEYGEDSPLFKSRVRGMSPSQAKDSLIMLEWIEQCIGLDIPLKGNNALGVDVANSEEYDKAALAWMTGNRLMHVEEFQCPNATHLAYNTVWGPEKLHNAGYQDFGTRKISQYKVTDQFIGIDVVGVGVATYNAYIDNALKLKAVVGLSGGAWKEAIPIDPSTIDPKDPEKKGKPMYTFYDLRTQMYWELREDLRNKRISIHITDELLLLQIKNELVAPKWSSDRGYIKVESKEFIKKRLGGKSPNVADAIAYVNWVRKGYRVKVIKKGAMPFIGGLT